MQKIMFLIFTPFIFCAPVLMGANFGKTHFIVGYEETALPTLIKLPTVPATLPSTALPFNLMHDNKINAVFFSPEDKVHVILNYLIGQEKQHFAIAMFTITDKKIAQALIDAQKRGVRVELITDVSSVYGKYNKLAMLHDGNVELYLYNPEQTKNTVPGLMHNKFFLFKDNMHGKSLVWTGSFNATVAASKLNRENVLISEEKLYVDKFTHEFNRLKACCNRYQKP